MLSPKDQITEERKKSTFSSTELYKVIYEEFAERRKYLGELIAKEKDFDQDEQPFLSRVDLHRHLLRRDFLFNKFLRKNQIQDEDEARFLLSQLNESGPLFLHIGMFMDALKTHSTTEQLNKWLPEAQALRIIGSYVQTELGHGTFLRGLETTATYDETTKEFILHSPTLTASKWWPGGLGCTANHAVVMAQLIIRGKKYGPHLFFVPLRSLKDHSPLPNITIGDIGPKLGANGIDNGFLRFNQYRLPRENMLMRFSRVEPDGTYVAPPHSKVTYSAMVATRVDFVLASFDAMAKAITIAIRYNAVRRQSTLLEGTLETQIIDYKTQQYRLFPLLALTYALHFNGKEMKKSFKQFMLERDQRGDFSGLSELHATSSGMKAATSSLVCEGIEYCRKSCGGFGYQIASGLPTLLARFLPVATVEGDNNILYLQTSRFLMKVVHTVLSGQEPKGTVDYFNSLKTPEAKCAATRAQEFLEPKLQLEIYARRSTSIVYQAFQVLSSAMTQNPSEAQQTASIEMIRAGRVHCMYILLRSFADHVEQIQRDQKISQAVKDVLVQLRNLFALSYIEQDSGEFLESGFLTNSQLDLIRRQQRELMETIRPNAVALVDSLGFTDYSLNSKIGVYDGNVYENLYNYANSTKNPLNTSKQRERTLSELTKARQGQSKL